MSIEYHDSNWEQLVPLGYQGVLPRRSRYGQDDAYELGLTPIEQAENIDVLAYEDLKEAITTAREAKAMPVFHQLDSWCDNDFRSNQNGLPYCWAWSATAAFMDLRALEAKETKFLSPVSLGWLVGWRARGYYLDETVSGIMQRGIAPTTHVDDNFNSTNSNPGTYRDGWEAEAKKYRLREVWDIDTRRGDKYIVQQVATAVCAGRSCYFAINAMSHAMQICGMHWTEGSYLNVKFDVRNSHNESTTLLTEGSRWIPDEAIVFVSSVLT